ncbi:MAG: prolipoprotein diacylglyceryl transferase [Methylotenera sp.]
MSFPYLSDLLKTLTGHDLFLPLPMFGLLVALAMLTAAACLTRELRRLHESGKIGMARVLIKENNGTLAKGLVPPQEIVPDFMMAVCIAGIIGARLFHILEHTDEFLIDPWGMIFTRSGLSIFGGLIFGTLVGLIRVKQWTLPIRPMLDAAAPAMMLGYAIGRIGCQISGDGDWGIAADVSLKPDWLPMWLWAQTYQHNIVGVVIPSPGVYPAPMYETMMCLACFVFLWIVRKHSYQMGWLFALYLLLAGAERLLIEQIRINPMFNILGFYATQAEMISVVLILLGLFGIVMLARVDKVTWT